MKSLINTLSFHFVLPINAFLFCGMQALSGGHTQTSPTLKPFIVFLL